MSSELVFANIFLSILLAAAAQGPLVEIGQGQLQGAMKTSKHGRPYAEFLGIPFADPPVGNLRFAAPVVSNDRWEGVRDATKNSPICAQTAGVDFLILGDEDCLYLNVYTPQLPNGTQPNLPVMVWIYGGGYSRGGDSTWMFGPERFMDYDLVYVSITYRVGPFGFLSTLDEVVPGNSGALDQVAALQWVQANIVAFGGDPNHVTIQGESAGSTSVSYLVLSQAAAGLFHAAIGESGSALCSWALQKDAMNFTNRMAMDLNCSIENTQVIVDCLRNRSAEDLVNAAFKLGDYNIIRQPFVPVVEDPAYGKFITDTPLNILNAGTFNKVPILTGCNHDEGTLVYDATVPLYDTIDDHFFDVVLPTIVFGMFKYDGDLVGVSYAIKAEYYDKIDVNDSNAAILTSIAMETDGVFLAPNDFYIKKLASYGLPVYSYIFSYIGASSINHHGGETQVSHGEELAYLFTYGTDNDWNANDTAVSDELLKMWTNFAITYNPNPTNTAEWEPVSESESKFLYILVPEESYMVSNYRSEQMYFWNYIVPPILLGN